MSKLALIALLALAVQVEAQTESVSLDTKTKQVKNPVVKFGSGNTLDCTGATVTNCGSGGGGSGTVTSFSAGLLSPLFTTSVATSTTTPALSFSLSTAAAHKFFGNNTGSTAAPGFQSIGTGDLPDLSATYVPTSRTISTTSPITGGGDLSANRTFAIPAATTSVNGYLTSTDWNTFNGKGSGTVTSIATTAPITGGTITGTGTLGLNVGVDHAFTAAQSISKDDSNNNSVSQLLSLTHTTSGTAASGIGTRISFAAEDASGSVSSSGALDFYLSDVTHAAPISSMNLLLRNAAGFTTPLKMYSDGALVVAASAGSDPGVPGIFARFIPVANSTTSATSWTPNSDTYDQEAQTALAGDVTINAPSGTPSDGKKLILRIKCGGTGRNITWNGAYVAMGVTLPTTISANKTIYAGCDYNSNTSKWDVLAVAIEP